MACHIVSSGILNPILTTRPPRSRSVRLHGGGGQPGNNVGHKSIDMSHVIYCTYVRAEHFQSPQTDKDTPTFARIASIGTLKAFNQLRYNKDVAIGPK